MGLLKTIKKLGRFIPGSAKRALKAKKFAARAEKIASLKQAKKVRRAANISRIRKVRKFKEAIPGVVRKAALPVAGLATGTAGGFFLGRRKKRSHTSRRR